MFQVILDTNILDRSPSRNNAEFHALQELSSNEKIQLHLPDIVQKEFLSHREEAIEKGVNSIAIGIKQLNKEKVAKQSQFSELVSWEERLNELKSQLVEATYEEFTQWCENLNIQLHKVASHHGEAVVQAYFKGNPPFKESRSKVGFADAFIWQTVLDILEKYKNVHFISNNTKDFGKLCEETKGVTLYTSLKAFLLSSTVQHLFLEQFTEQNFETILAVLRQKETDILPKLVHKVYEAFSSSDYFLVENLVESPADISGWSYSGERGWQVEILYDEADHYGYGIISLSLVATIEEFNVSYTKTINTTQPLPPHTKMHASFKSGDNTSLFIEDYFILKLYASADLVLATSNQDALKKENIPNLIERASINVSEIDYLEPDETSRERFESIV